MGHKPNRCISIIMIAVMIACTMSAVCVFADEQFAGSTSASDNDQKAETIKPEMMEKINILTALGIIRGYEDGTFKLEDNITRGELAVILCRSMGIENLGQSVAGALNENSLPFSDVTADYWAAADIFLAVKSGLMTGTGNGLFKPDEIITWQQAVKALVNLLGYGFKAEGKGGWPYGYTAVAAEIRLTDGLAFKDGFTREDLINAFVKRAFAIGGIKKRQGRN